MTRVGAVDCGTNTIKLLVADLDPVTGAVDELVRESRMVRLGQGVDRTGRLADEALARVFEAVEEFATLVAPHEDIVFLDAQPDADESEPDAWEDDTLEAETVSAAPEAEPTAPADDEPAEPIDIEAAFADIDGLTMEEKMALFS